VRPYPLTVLNGGINRLRVKGGASASQLYDLTNAYITNAGSIVPREGTTRFATLSTLSTQATVGLAAANGTFNIFSSQFSTGVPAGFTLNVLQDPVNTTASVTKIWFAKPFMGFEYVVAQFSDGLTFHYWLQNDGTWTSNTVYTSASIVLPPVANGLAYQGVSRFTSGTSWTPETVITSGGFILPTTPTGFVYEITGVAGTPAHTGAIEPQWPITSGAQIQEFGDFDQSSSDHGTTGPYTTGANLSSTITNKYGDSATIANSGIFVSSIGTLSTLTLASTKVKSWTAGTTYPSGSVVIPTVSSSSSTFINAIPNGDFAGGSGAGGWTFADPGGAGEWTYTTGAAPVSIGIGADVGGASIGIPGGTSFGSSGPSATMITSGAVTPGQTVIATGYCNPNNNGADLTIWLQLNWYDKTNTFISQTGNQVNEQEGFSTVLLSVKGVAPSGAAGVRVAVYAGSGTMTRNEGYVGGLFWNLASPSLPTNFLYEAVQPSSGISAATEPTWPTTLGLEVVDGSVTWQAIGTSIITYEAIPLMESGANAPVFPTTIGAVVLDTSTFTDINGHIINTTMLWKAISREVSDPNNPGTSAVAIGASHVFAGNNDIVDYSAAVNPIDWSSTNNAGYLPTGLNNYGDNPVTALALYRGNLIVFNAGGYQMWQIDPDPQNMAFLDAQPVGCIWTRSCQSVANDLIFLTEIGVRNLGTIGATANMAIGNTGQPVDPLILAQIQAATYDPFTIYYPGRGQYMLIYGPQMFVLTINGLQGTKSWSRYIFPQAITDATLNSGSLFLRTTGSLIWQMNADTTYDDSGTETQVAVISTIQWPYADMGGLGLNKMLIGVDLVGDGGCILQIGFDQQDDTTFDDNAGFATSTGVTAPYFIQVDDTVPGEPLPIPINAPSYSLILTFPGYLTTGGTINTWTWEAANFYLAPQGGGGVTG